MNARKVLEMGGGTLLVSLPKSWARKNGLAKGSTVDVEEIAGGKLLVKPMSDAVQKPKEIDVEYPKDDLTLVANDITGAYLLGYDVIKVVGGKMIPREDRARLKTTIARLVGLEIMGEDSKQITMQFLLEPSIIDPEKLVRRMATILEGMIRDTAEGVAKSDPRLLTMVSERDDEVDRLYFLLVRTIRSAVVHQDVGERYGLAPVDVLDFRVLASFLESVGDAMAELAKSLGAVKLARQVARRYAACVLKLQDMGDHSVRAFLARGARSREEYSRVAALSEEISSALVEIARMGGTDSSAVVETLGSVERVSKLLVDISDLAVPTRILQRTSAARAPNA